MLEEEKKETATSGTYWHGFNLNSEVKAFVDCLNGCMAPAFNCTEPPQEVVYHVELSCDLSTSDGIYLILRPDWPVT